MQVFFLTMVSRPMSIADPARVQNEALEMLRHRQGQMNPDNLYLQSYPNNHFLVVLFLYDAGIHGHYEGVDSHDCSECMLY